MLSLAMIQYSEEYWKNLYTAADYFRAANFLEVHLERLEIDGLETSSMPVGDELYWLTLGNQAFRISAYLRDQYQKYEILAKNSVIDPKLPKLYIVEAARYTSGKHPHQYYASSYKPGGSESSYPHCVYFRVGHTELFDHKPTWFKTSEEAIAAIKSVGFSQWEVVKD